MLVTQLMLIIYKILGVRHFLQKIFGFLSSFPGVQLGLIEAQLYKVMYHSGLIQDTETAPVNWIERNEYKVFLTRYKVIN